MHGTEVRWNLIGLGPGSYKATVKRDDFRNSTRTCSIQVIIPEPLSVERLRATPQYFITRAILLSDRHEEPGYGLYSYVLFSTPPDPDDTTMYERYLKIVEVYLRMMEPLSRFEHEVQPSHLNVTHVPINAMPVDVRLEDTIKSDTRKAAERLVERYDYARAQLILYRAGLTNRKGPYLLSSLNPLGRYPAARPFFVQDLSNIPPEQAGEWLREFINQTAQERFWEPRALPQLTLKMKAIVSDLLHRTPSLEQQAILGIIVMK